MSKLQWYINRLRAMNVREVLWRLDQKRIERAEAKRFGKDRVSVGACLFPEYSGLRFDADSLGIAWSGDLTNTRNTPSAVAGSMSPSAEGSASASESELSASDALSSSGIHADAATTEGKIQEIPYSNDNHNTSTCSAQAHNDNLLANDKWASRYGFNTEVKLLKGTDFERWPDTFSYKLNYKQRDDLGDARTNWEKNRHFEWALLAKRYYVLSKYDNENENENCLAAKETLDVLVRTVEEWMERNPFLHGISWTSAMEFAIRSINWMYALAFLSKTNTINTPAGSESACKSENLSKLNSSASQSASVSLRADMPDPAGKKQEIQLLLRNGIINITDYLTKHYSRFSSANNHLLVEATAIGLAGYAFGHRPWQELAIRILTEEIEKQNYSDGVNKELSLHYRTFGMEAYLLMAHVMMVNETNTINTPAGSESARESEIESKLSSSASQSASASSRADVPDPAGKIQEIPSCAGWFEMLRKEAEFVAHSTWREKVVCEFGDDDEGKIIDLQGRPNENASTGSAQAHNENGFHQWDYVLQLASLVTGVRYSDFKTEHENIHWLFSEAEIENIKKQPYFASIDNHESCITNRLKSRCFEVGGNTFLRDREDRVLIGIDHAELGFGSIAAHGHADALSFQMLVDGEVVFADPGTYIYHCDLPSRDAFRRTINHNTLCLINENENDNASTGSAQAPNRFRDQSKMLGAFMWGDRAVCTLEKWASDEEKDILIASHDGYKPVVHRRRFEWDKVGRRLTITDNLLNDNDNDNHNHNENDNCVVTFMLGADVVVNENHNDNENDNCIRLKCSTAIIDMTFEGADRIQIEDAELSPEYGVKVPSRAIRAYGHETTITTTITISLG